MKWIIVLVASIFLNSCKNDEREIIVYFSNCFFDDGPIKWPDFTSYEKLLPETIRILEDVTISSNTYDWLEDTVLSKVRNNRTENRPNSLYGGDENIFLVLNKRDSVYFTSSNDFFDARDNFLFNNKVIADRVKLIINYAANFQGHESAGDTIYSKIRIKIDKTR